MPRNFNTSCYIKHSISKVDFSIHHCIVLLASFQLETIYVFLAFFVVLILKLSQKKLMAIPLISFPTKLSLSKLHALQLTVFKFHTTSATIIHFSIVNK